MYMKKILGSLTIILASIYSLAQSSGPPTLPEAQVSTEQQKTSAEDPARNFFGQTFAGHWAFTTEFGYDQEYDDNIFSSDLLRLSDNVSRFSARFTAAVQKKRLRMQVHYFPDYASYAKYSDRNALSHQYSHEIDYQLSAHTNFNWTLFASRAPGYTNSPMQLGLFDGVVLPVFRPDALQSDATILNANTSLSLSHRFSARQTLTVGLQGTAVRFSANNGVPLSSFVAQKSFSNSATISWEDEFVPRKKIGIEVSDEYFGFLDPGSHSHYQFVKLRYSQSFGHGYQFSAGAGPSRRERQVSNIFPGSATSTFHYSVDASIAKVSQRQSIGVTYNHGTQLGLTQGSLGSDTLSLSVMREIGRKWRVDGSFGYSRTITETTFLQGTTNSYSTSANLGYQWLPSLALNAGYSYINQAAFQNLPGALVFGRNVFRVGIKYTFNWTTSR